MDLNMMYMEASKTLEWLDEALATTYPKAFQMATMMASPNLKLLSLPIQIPLCAIQTTQNIGT